MPVLPSLVRMVRDKYTRPRLKSQNTEEVFTNIFRRNKWGGKDSVSGTGSDSFQSRFIIEELPSVFSDFGISTMLDIPCGDFNWMKKVKLNDIEYTGADIVTEMVENNIQRYERTGVHFRKLNLITDTLPKVDLIFTRDCLVHLSFQDVFRALDNICKSQSEYLITTTFTGRKKNRDIATGQWRVLNLEIAPFLLPRASRIISEGCTEGDGDFADKALGLWRIADVRESLTRR